MNLTHQAPVPNELGNLDVVEEEEKPTKNVDMAPLKAGKPLPLLFGRGSHAALA